MKKHLILVVFSISSILLFSGCTREVPIKLPIYEKANCKEAHKVKITNLAVIGKNVLDVVGGVTSKELKRDDKIAWLIVPKNMSDELFLDVVFIYTKSNALNLTDCIRFEQNRGDKYEAFNLKINESIK